MVQKLLSPIKRNLEAVSKNYDGFKGDVNSIKTTQASLQKRIDDQHQQLQTVASQTKRDKRKINKKSANNDKDTKRQKIRGRSEHAYDDGDEEDDDDGNDDEDDDDVRSPPKKKFKNEKLGSSNLFGVASEIESMMARRDFEKEMRRMEREVEAANRKNDAVQLALKFMRRSR